MMASIFILIFFSVLFAFGGLRRITIYCMSLTLILAVIYFYGDITTHLNLQL